MQHLQNEIILNKLINNIRLNNYSKITLINFFEKSIKPGMLLYIILKPNLTIHYETISGICIAKKKHLTQTSIHILNITLNMKVLNVLLSSSPLIFLWLPIFKRKYLYKLYFKINLIKLFYLNELNIKYLRTNIITKTIID